MTKAEIRYTTPDGPRARVVDLAAHPIESLRSLRIDGVDVPLEQVLVFEEDEKGGEGYGRFNNSFREGRGLGKLNNTKPAMAPARRNLATDVQYWSDRLAAGARPQEEKSMKPWQAFTTESRRAFHISDVLLFLSGAMAIGASVVSAFIWLTHGLQYESSATMMWAFAFCFLALERLHKERGK